MEIVSERALGRWENEGGGLARELRDQFPGVRDWHYLDTAATAQKPQVVIEAVSRAMGEDYATVHRGVYARSANMTLAYEAARRRVAESMPSMGTPKTSLAVRAWMSSPLEKLCFSCGMSAIWARMRSSIWE